MKKNHNHHRAYFATGEFIDVYGGKTYFKRKIRLVLSSIEEPAFRKVWFRETPELVEAAAAYDQLWHEKYCRLR